MLYWNSGGLVLIVLVGQNIADTQKIEETDEWKMLGAVSMMQGKDSKLPDFV